MYLSYEFRFSVGLIQAYERDVTAHHFASPLSGSGRMTAKAESPPTNGNEMKVLRRTLCFWSNGALALGFTFITDNRDINGILMIRNRHQDFRNGRFLVPSAAIVVRTAV